MIKAFLFFNFLLVGTKKFIIPLLTRPNFIIKIVEIILRQIFCAVPAFNLVDPTTVSGPVSNNIGNSEILLIKPLELFEMPIVKAPLFFASLSTSHVNGVFPLAANPITTSF